MVNPPFCSSAKSVLLWVLSVKASGMRTVYDFETETRYPQRTSELTPEELRPQTSRAHPIPLAQIPLLGKPEGRIPTWGWGS